MDCEVKIEANIPAPGIWFPPIEGRGFNGGTKCTLHYRIKNVLEENNSLIELKRTWYETKEYENEDMIKVEGQPGWYRNLKPDAKVIDRATLETTNENLKFSEKSTGTDDEMHHYDWIIEGGNPLLPDLAPNITMFGNLYFSRKIGRKKELHYRHKSFYDGFPDYKIWINGSVIMHHSCIKEEQTPLSLAPPMEFEKSGIWTKL